MRISFGPLWLLITAGVALAQSGAPPVDRVLTRQQQEALTPDDVLRELMQGNQRFVSETLTTRDHSAMVRDAVNGQFPMAAILSCVDSRIPVEDVFDRGIGDVFVARVAGNFENTDILGSMEFATKISGAKLVLVLGHENCGAVRSAIDGADLGNITAMLENIKLAVDALSGYQGDKTSANPKFVHLVVEKNVTLTIDRIRERSPILKGMEEQGKLRIVGALYDMKSGKIELLD